MERKRERGGRERHVRAVCCHLVLVSRHEQEVHGHVHGGGACAQEIQGAPVVDGQAAGEVEVHFPGV